MAILPTEPEPDPTAYTPNKEIEMIRLCLVALLFVVGFSARLQAQPKAPPVTVDDRLSNLEARVTVLEDKYKLWEQTAKIAPAFASTPKYESSTYTPVMTNSYPTLPYAPTRYYPAGPLPPLPPSGNDFGSFGYGTYSDYGFSQGEGACANGSCSSGSTSSRRGLFGRRR